MYNDPNFRNLGTNQFRGSLHARWDRLARSGGLTAVSLFFTLALCAVLWMAHLKGRIHQLTTAQDSTERSVVAVRPGGQDLVHLNPVEVAGSIVPEFASATLAPGDGMLLLQVLLNLPGRGDVPILLGTRETEIAFGSTLTGADFSARAEVYDRSHWSAPLELIMGHPAVQQDTVMQPGGSRSEAHFSPDAPSGSGSLVHTGVESRVSASLTGRNLELSMSAKNTSNEPRGVTLAWRPRFVGSKAGLKSLSFLPPARADANSGPKGEEQLGVRAYDELYAPLQHSYLSAGPELRLQNQMDGYSLRFTALTSSIRSIHIQASPLDPAVLVAFSTALRNKGDDTRTILAPGEELKWRVRVEAIPNAAYTASGAQ